MADTAQLAFALPGNLDHPTFTVPQAIAALEPVWAGIACALDAGDAVTAPSGLPAAANRFVADLRELRGRFEGYAAVCADCQALRQAVKDSLASMTAKGRLARVDIEAFARAVGLMDDKLHVLAFDSRALSTRVTALTSAMPANGTVKPQAIRKAKAALHVCLTGLASASAEIDAARRHLVLMKKQLGLAKGNARKDSSYGWAVGWVATVSRSAGEFRDFRLEPAGWVAQVDGAIRLFCAAADPKAGG